MKFSRRPIRSRGGKLNDFSSLFKSLLSSCSSRAPLALNRNILHESIAFSRKHCENISINKQKKLWNVNMLSFFPTNGYVQVTSHKEREGEKEKNPLWAHMNINNADLKINVTSKVKVYSSAWAKINLAQTTANKFSNTFSI